MHNNDKAALPPKNGSAPKRTLFVPWLAVPLILLILASAIFIALRHLRHVASQEISRRDGYALLLASKVEIDPVTAQDPELRPFVIENKALEVAKLFTNIIALRLYDSSGLPQLVLPPSVKSASLSTQEFARALTLQLAGQFIEAADLSEIFETIHEPKNVPLLRFIVPLEASGGLLAIAEFFMDGRNVEAALATLDNGLWRYGAVLFIISGGATALALALAFGRLQKSNALLAQRTESLLKANHELTLAAKTSAVGAITAHLIHDLKSPLFGLQTFVAAKGADASPDSDWTIALSTTERMQKMINDVVRILQEEKTTIDYELSIREMFRLLRAKIEPLAKEAGLALECSGETSPILSNRDANIVLLILTNLAQNAIQATPRGGAIRIHASRENSGLNFDVTDTGPGLPPHILETLFTPSRSTKKSGTGIGLAISKQLANHAGAELQLQHTSPSGTTFRLRLNHPALA